VLNPAGRRIDLTVFLLGDRDGLTARVNDHAAGAGCALIDGRNVFGHSSLILPAKRLFTLAGAGDEGTLIEF
jgi:hypothetical protein